MSKRYLIAGIFLGLVFALAGLLNLGWSIWWLKPLQWLGRFQWFHIVAHFSIFAGVVFLTYPQKRTWFFVLGGAVIIELVQLAAAGFVLTRSLFFDSSFDIVVDLIGAGVCWLMLALRRLTQSYAIG